MFKICKECEEEKPLEEFGNSGHRTCKPCKSKGLTSKGFTKEELMVISLHKKLYGMWAR